ncbi:MAG: sulfotransferase [Rhodospirillales bacterium]
MRGGHVDSLSRRTVAGWAADAERPALRLTVSISVDGVHLADVVAERPRNDLASLGRFGDGRHGFLFTFPEPLGAERDHVVVVSYQEDGKPLPNGRHTVARAQVPSVPAHGAGADPAVAAQRLFPILVTAPGRSGTTLLMGLLARAEEIVAAELVPYEVRLISYHAAAFNVLTTPADLEHSSHPDRLEGDGYHIGFNPFHSPQYAQAFRAAAPVRDYFDQYAPDRLADNARDLIEEYYRRLARDKGKQAGFFAEKGNNLHKPTRMFTRRVFGRVRELVIVRDPRDVLCSHMAYFSSSADKAFTQLSHASKQLLAIRDEAREDIHILRYEDMVRGDEACFEAMSAFLGVRIEPDAGDRGREVFRRHGTSVSPEASVARWRSNLPDALKARCAADWGAFFSAFGYPEE